jgi:glycosyltransferase involved in cell wall biosynthesis
VRVGVVVPVLDVAPWLDAMLSSLRAQSHEDWTAVVVDDGSTDATVALAERHAAADPRIRVSRNAEQGPGARLARIHGRSMLPGDVDYLYFPDGDDLLERTLLERLVGRLESGHDAVAAFCDYATIADDGSPLGPSTHRRLALTHRWARALPGSEEDTPFATLYAEAPAWEGLTVFRRSAYDEAGGLEHSPAWASHTTLDLLLRMCALGRIVFVPEDLYSHRLRAGQTSMRVAMLRANGTELRRLWRKRAATDAALSERVAHGEFLFRHRATPKRRLERAAALARRGNIVAAVPRVVLAFAAYRARIPGAVRSSAGLDS